MPIWRLPELRELQQNGDPTVPFIEQLSLIEWVTNT